MIGCWHCELKIISKWLHTVTLIFECPPPTHTDLNYFSQEKSFPRQFREKDENWNSHSVSNLNDKKNSKLYLLNKDIVSTFIHIISSKIERIGVYFLKNQQKICFLKKKFKEFSFFFLYNYLELYILYMINNRLYLKLIYSFFKYFRAF